MKSISVNPNLAKDAKLFMFVAMKTTALLSLLIASSALADEQRATATWMTAKNVSVGGPIQTVIQMKITEGWHTYWKNPGEGGIPVKIEAKLPEGWTLGEIQYPAPRRFTNGELPSIGYEGEVTFPITIYPAKGSNGSLPQIQATLSWLTCNESSCVPGEANITLCATGDATSIQKAYQAIPKPLEEAKLDFVADEKQVILNLTLPEKSKIDPSTYEVFPVTPDVISAAPAFKFTASKDKPGTWTATAKSSEYIDLKLKSLTIELFKSGGESWSVSSMK